MRPDDWDEIYFFKPHEFKHPELMGYEFMLWLDRVRALAQCSMIITSDHRTRERNEEIGGATHSAHTEVPCDTVDIGKRPTASDPNWNEARFRITWAAMKMGCKRIGTYRDGSMHIDRAEKNLPSPRLWLVVR
jgi:hypothetical protein